MLCLKLKTSANTHIEKRSPQAGVYGMQSRRLKRVLEIGFGMYAYSSKNERLASRLAEKKAQATRGMGSSPRRWTEPDLRVVGVVYGLQELASHR
jgi:hypothetical protein